MSLTKQQAIENHRKIWNWIAEQSLKQQRCITKCEAVNTLFGYNVVIIHDCWCCDYAYTKRLHQGSIINKSNKPCIYCPLTISCGCENSSYQKWLKCLEKHDYEMASFFC